MTPLEREIAKIAEAQGWTDETIGMLAYGFIVHAASPLTRVEFLQYCWETQATENEVGLDV